MISIKAVNLRGSWYLDTLNDECPICRNCILDSCIECASHIEHLLKTETINNADTNDSDTTYSGLPDLIPLDISENMINPDISSNNINSDVSGNHVHIDVSGNHVHSDVSGNHVHSDVSGNRIKKDISGNTINTYQCVSVLGECGHVYHLHCIEKWLKTRNVCPLDNKTWVYKKNPIK